MKFTSNITAAAVILIGSLLPGTAWAKSPAVPQPARPVLITEGLCVEAEVFGLTGKGRMTVRTSPSATAKAIDRLPNDQFVFACQGVRVGKVDWVGIVYSRVGHGEECGDGVDSAPSTTQYTYGPAVGPCWSGWVTLRYLSVNEG